MVQETITSNIHDDIITLEFQRTDGTLITQLIDFRSVSIVNLFPTHSSDLFARLVCDENKFDLNARDMDES